ncbi:MAG: hypothetical protein CSB55_03280 [Candidatus Cloacimonadota bacterium]|nr:MAG: hypothetical protein CSB55_03280 [Candidatus Cloacimonadota bacterium]
MKKILTVLVLLSAFAILAADNLKIACFDSEKIMLESKDAIEAKKMFDNDAAEWQRQLSEKEQEIKRLNSEYEARRLTMTESSKKETEEQIRKHYEELQRLTQEIFGENGRAAQRNQELLSPIMDKLKNAIEKISVDNNYQMVLDVAAGGVMYVVPSLDITEDIISEMDK